MAAKTGQTGAFKRLSYEQYEKYGANATGRIKLTIGAAAGLTISFNSLSVPDITNVSHIYAHTAILQFAESNTGHVSFSNENALDAGQSAQNTVRWGAGDTVTLRFNDLALLYWEATAAGQVVFIQYFYYDDSIGLDIPKGAV
jgi:hypothetical protein